jgi:Flp pilus assembly protein TadD
MRIRFILSGLLAALASGCFTLGKTIPTGEQASDLKAPEKLQLPPRDGARACLATAEMLEKNGNLLEATALYDRARSLDPAYESVSRRLAVLYDCQGAFVQADAEYQRALQFAPHDSDLWNDYGYSLYCRGNWEEAEHAFRQSLGIKTDNKRAWVNLGLTLAQAGRTNEGYEAFTRAVPPAQAHCNLGFIFATQGRKADALREYELALALAPDLQVAQAAITKLRSAESPVPARPAKPTPARAPAVEDRKREPKPKDSPPEAPIELPAPTTTPPAPSPEPSPDHAPRVEPKKEQPAHKPEPKPKSEPELKPANGERVG